MSRMSLADVRQKRADSSRFSRADIETDPHERLSE